MRRGQTDHWRPVGTERAGCTDTNSAVWVEQHPVALIDLGNGVDDTPRGIVIYPHAGPEFCEQLTVRRVECQRTCVAELSHGLGNTVTISAVCLEQQPFEIA